MFNKFGEYWKEIARGNQIADELAKEAVEQSNIHNFSLPNLPKGSVTTPVGNFTHGTRRIIKDTLKARMMKEADRKSKMTNDNTFKIKQCPIQSANDYKKSDYRPLVSNYYGTNYEHQIECTRNSRES